MSEGLFDVPDDPSAPAARSHGAPEGTLSPLAVRMRPVSLDEVVGQ
ncbi:AAA family ATPase, partial [Mycobacterium sp. ITM-2017-0098]